MKGRKAGTAEISGWGRYPSTRAETIIPFRKRHVEEYLSGSGWSNLVARGLGRAYGDSALAPAILSTVQLDRFIRIDQSCGRLACSAGVSFADILSVMVPRGWFPPVTPGTMFVTIGGAIAGDVHGKNHHLEGSFCDHVISLKIATASGEVVECSREHNPALFLATCGGMGLTGVILEAEFNLKPIRSSSIAETVIRAGNLEEALALFDQHRASAYSVAWIDCLASGGSLGRSLLMTGEHCIEGELAVPGRRGISVPFDLPGLLLNRYSVGIFNSVYYRRTGKMATSGNTDYRSFFYPLDLIQRWNRIYGRKGFIQYQPVFPKTAGPEGITLLLQRVAESRRGSFLAVLKAFGQGNRNFLSFPMEGYTLALDFKMSRDLFGFLDELDRIVLDFGGRLYLAKDARMTEETFKKSYPQWEQFMEVRTGCGAHRVFNSLQSRRLGL